MSTSAFPAREPRLREGKDPTHSRPRGPRLCLSGWPGPAGQDCLGTKPLHPPSPGTGHSQALLWTSSEAGGPARTPFSAE